MASLALIVMACVSHDGCIAGKITCRRTSSDTGPPVQNDVAGCGLWLPWPEPGPDRRRESGRYGGVIVSPSGPACHWNRGTISNWLKSYFSHY